VLQSFALKLDNIFEYMSIELPLKRLEHKSLGWKLLKYNLDMSLGEEVWCWMPDSYDNIFKKMKMHENWGKSLFCSMDKKMISPHTEWCIGKSPG